jgi:xanthine dehydrogenase YagR molybdenum-binding subunit
MVKREAGASPAIHDWEFFDLDVSKEASPLGAKGLGELTGVSVAPAITNAVYHATGKRIRDQPVTVEKLL